MKKLICMSVIAAITATMTGLTVFGDITVHDGETLLVGTIGTGINNKNDGSIITLEAGATLKGTNDPPYESWTIWRNIYSTNGVAYLDCSEMTPAPTFTKNVILTGGLVVKGQTTVGFADNNPAGDKNWFIRDLSGLSFESGSGTVLMQKQTTLVSTPTDENVACTYDPGTSLTMKALAIAGPNLRISQVQDNPADFSALEKTYLFDDSYIPEGHSIKVGAAIFRIHPATVNRATRSWVTVEGSGVVTHPISLSGGTLEICAPLNTSYAFNETISGSGTINFRRDLAPSVTSCSFATLDGSFTFATGVSGRTMTVTIANLAAGSILNDGGTVNVTFSDPLVASNVKVMACSDGSICYVMPNDDGSITADALPTVSRKLSDHTLIGGETTIKGMPAEGSRIGAAKDARVTVTHDGSHVLNVVPGEGVLAVGAGVSESLPLYWFDASKPYDWENHGGDYYAAPGSANTNGADYGNIIMTNNFPYIESWNDWRGVTSGKFYLGRYYQGGQYTYYPHSYPYLAVGSGPNGLSYLNFGCYNDYGNDNGKTAQPMTQTNHTDVIKSSIGMASRRRLDFTKSTAPKSVIMVFGSQQGGGDAVLGTGSNHHFLRGRTLEDPMVNTAPANTTFWLDGVKVEEPTTQLFNGGWQIVSISGDAVTKTIAIGYDADYQDAGGQNYGEIIFFKDELTDAVRLRYEQYLAAKWGIAINAEGTPDVVRAAGQTGTLELNSAMGTELRGTFAGEVRLNGGRLTISEPLPPAAEDLPSEGRLQWFDADFAGAIVNVSATFGEKTYDNIVRGLLSRGVAYSDVKVDDYYLYGTGERAPFSVRSARGLAAERTWIDFNHPVGYPTKGDDGNNLRFATFGEKRQVSAPKNTGVAQTFRTAFMAMDSSMGGGTPLLSVVGGGSGDFRCRDNPSVVDRLWPVGNSANVTNGITRINGEVVDGTKPNVLTGEPETLTLVAKGDVSAAFIEHFGSSQSVSSQQVSKGLIFGELLLYTTELSAADIAKVEAYLQGKWTGTLPAGYSDLRGATVDGNGTMSVSDAARLPQIKSTFDGSVEIGGETAEFPFTIGGDGVVVGAINTPKVIYAMPSSATLKVTATKRLACGRYTLITYRGLANSVAWNLEVINKGSRNCRLSVETNSGVTSVIMDVSGPGAILFLR